MGGGKSRAVASVVASALLASGHVNATDAASKPIDAKSLDRAKLAVYRRSRLTPGDNRALAACAECRGDVLIVESEHDDVVPHPVLENYRAAFLQTRSMTYRVIGKENLTIGGKQQEATKVSRVDGNKELIAWIVPEFPVPARLLQRESGKDALDLTIKGLN